MKKYIKNAGKLALNLIFPEVCVYCGKALSFKDVTADYITCSNCLKTLPFISGDTCQKCGLPMDELADCHCGEFHFERNYSLFVYDGEAEKVVKDFKYQGKQRYAYASGKLMASKIEFDVLDEIDAVLSVPLHKKHLHRRGYNQAASICAGLAASYGIPILTGLRRLRRTKALSQLDAKQRMEAVSGAFMYIPMSNELDINGKNLLLVDDILTTGATLNECSQVLKEHGAKAVYCMTFARTALRHGH
jgi:ComF family protein